MLLKFYHKVDLSYVTITDIFITTEFPKKF